MIATKDTDRDPQWTDHRAKSGDTPALGLEVVPGSGGRRFAPDDEADDRPADAIRIDDDVLWRGIPAIVTEVFPAGPAWMLDTCKIAPTDGAPHILVCRDELDLVQLDDGARYFVSRAYPAVDETGPLPSPVPRLGADDDATDVLAAAALLEEQPDDQDRPTAHLAAVGQLPARKVGAFAAVWLGLLDILRVIGEFLAWPFRRDGGRALVALIVAEVADAVDDAADWQHRRAELIAKVIVAALSALVLAGVGAAWLLTVVFA